MFKKQYSKSKPICKVTFELPLEAAPEAEEIRLLGDFNGWNSETGIVMTKNKTGYKATVELETGRNYEFRYLVNGESWMNHWGADGYTPSPYHGIDNSVIIIEKIEIPAPKPKKAAAKPAAKKPAVKAAKKPAPAKAAKKAAPEKKPVAAKTVKDDLKKIEGVGPKIAELLNKGGIHSFQDLADAKVATLKAILDDAGPRYKMHDPGTWAKQAKLAVNGKWDQLEALQKELKGGKKK